ncbi:AAA-like domain-containing protein [Mastigocoleus sp. MO_188.B34]|uniref:AAA-like domain-containing protein n=1 Tax=Mastigocoleus sp. MO_188.B34 TaxID=3036635 RepID=UPI00263594A3|nr:AAA-like domain-containing protein [Mastigocoleus sp. MO_188.B34]MDJ0694045.1 GUN4 domain-containing protein [Mastigocoleus sp. MO_188.B34]
MFDEDEYIHEYIFSGSLPENASTYVKREADDELYQALQDGKFCYVLNSRQSGKSSLRVKTMSRLTDAGVECASIDLSSVSIQSATQENWYADLIVKLIDSFVLDVNFKDWWEKNQINSPLMRFSNFLEKHLLVEIEENIVIFIDEIDSVLSLNFPTDDFFAFIRACYNQRVDNPAYKRLTFCLLGVASPGNLIQDKSRTPFNIGQAISLKGFQMHETEPLIRGLQGKFSEPRAVMEEILDWTGGQPFLTQKLCQFMLEESEQEKPHNVGEVVKSRIIENWESQDEPEHLRTIRSRIFRNEERAGYLLELYQQIRCLELESEIIDPPNPPYEGGLESSSLSISITADNTIEQSELLLSGLVARREGELRVYNKIYQEVFNQNWVKNELKNLRPYSESFKFWVSSGGKDESRLLRGKALAGAEKWAKDKNLSYQDKQFLAASREKEIQEKIAVQEKEAIEQRNKVLSEANKKAKQRIRIGSIVLILTVLGAAIAGLLASKDVMEANHQVAKAQKDVQIAWENAKTATKREKEAIQNKKAAEKELDKKKIILREADVQRNKLKQEAQELNIKAKESSKQLEISKKLLISVKNSRQELKTQIQKIKQDKELFQKQLSNTQSELNNTQQQYEKFKKQVADSEEYLKTVEKLATLAGKLEDEGSDSEAKELLSQAGQSVNIKDHKLRQAVLYSGISYAHQKLKEKDLKLALDFLNKSKNQWKYLQGDNSNAASQIRILTLKTSGNLFKEQGNIQQAINAYKLAYNILKSLKSKGKRGKGIADISPPFQNLPIKILSKQNVEAFHREFIDLLSKAGDENLNTAVKESLKEYYLDDLNNLLINKKWGQADRRTNQLMLYVGNGEEQNYLNSDSLKNFSCENLRDIDSIWVEHSNQRFGFSVQKKIWLKTGNRIGINDEFKQEDQQAYIRWISRLGWYHPSGKNWARYTEVISTVDKNYQEAPKGILPRGESLPRDWFGGGKSLLGILFSRAATCKL